MEGAHELLGQPPVLVAGAGREERFDGRAIDGLVIAIVVVVEEQHCVVKLLLLLLLLL